MSYSDEKEHEDNKIYDTFIKFNKDDNGQINNIKLSRQYRIMYNDGLRTTQNITEIKLQNNKISKIDKYQNVHTEKLEGAELKEKNTRTQIASITCDESIEKKSKTYLLIRMTLQYKTSYTNLMKNNAKQLQTIIRLMYFQRAIRQVLTRMVVAYAIFAIVI